MHKCTQKSTNTDTPNVCAWGREGTGECMSVCKQKKKTKDANYKSKTKIKRKKKKKKTERE